MATGQSVSLPSQAPLYPRVPVYSLKHPSPISSSASETMMTHFIKSCVPILVATLVIVSSDAAHLPFRPSVLINENSLSPVAKYGGQSYEVRDWVKIKHSGPRMNRVPSGGRLELECEANGSPPPSVQWYHNASPVSQEQEENNSIGGGLRLGNIMSRLVIDCVTPLHQGTYTCVAVSGTERFISQPSVLFVQGNNGSGLQPSCSQTMTAPPRIVTWSPYMMETMGNDVLLPCLGVGSPQPQVYWIDGQNNLITSGPDMPSDDRFKVLDSGELMISSVRWTDMGYYTCVAESPLGRDTVATFLYPMSKDH